MTPEQIRAELIARNMKIRDLAEATGINENYLTKSLGAAGRRLQVQEMNAILEVFAPEDGHQGIRTIPHLGGVPASSFKPAEQRGGRRLAVSDPATPANAYALTVEGDSMDEVVPSGTTIIIDPDDKKLWPGKRYVVQTDDGQTTFKEYQEAPARLVPCSSNPEHREILIGDEPLLILGRVYSYTLKDADLPRRTRQ